MKLLHALALVTLLWFALALVSVAVGAQGLLSTMMGAAGATGIASLLVKNAHRWGLT